MRPLHEQTLPELWRSRVDQRGAHPALVTLGADGPALTHSYRDLDRLAGGAAARLDALGVEPGAAVVVQVAPGPELLAAFLAVTGRGAVAVVLHPDTPAEECAQVIARTGARVAVRTPDLADRFVTAAQVVDPAEWEPGPPLSERPIPPVGAEDVASIVFTSGSTATPKGVLLTHANLLFSGRYVQWQAALTEQDRLLTTMPACHVNFQLNAMLPILTAGGTLIVVDRYSARRFWDQVREHRATVVQSIAMMVRTQLCQPVRPGEREHQVREVLYYLPITDAEKDEYTERFGVRLLNSYGNSECLVGAITDPPTGPRRWPSIGRVGPGYQARIADAEGQELPDGEVGEIQLRGTPGVSLMAGYLDDPEATAALYDADGWMHTGDLGRRDPDGWFTFLDRRTRVIKRGAENISPARVEAVLAAHPAVAEASVIGIPDPIYDQAVKAVVVPRAGSSLTAAELTAHCAARLPRFMVPSVVDLVDQLPRTRSFKVATSALE
jgi:carnitine-CoA ligase